MLKIAKANLKMNTFKMNDAFKFREHLATINQQ